MRIIELPPIIATTEECCRRLKTNKVSVIFILAQYIVVCKTCRAKFEVAKFVNGKFIPEGKSCDYIEGKQNYKQYVYIKV